MSALIVVLMIGASTAALLVDGLYQDPDGVTAMFRGYDMTVLVFAAPLLTVALLPSLRRSPRVQLLWLGVLAYSVCTYAIYVFGASFNDLFLAHVALFSLSVFALVFGLVNVDVAGIGTRFHPRTPVRTISVILLLLGGSLGAMWGFSSLRFAITGQIPQEGSTLVLPGAMTHLGYVLDLSLLVPGYLLAAVLLLRRAAWGYLLATVLLVAGVLQQVGYLMALVFQADAKIAGAEFDTSEPFIAAAFLLAASLFLASCGRGSASAKHFDADTSAGGPARR